MKQRGLEHGVREGNFAVGGTGEKGEVGQVFHLCESCLSGRSRWHVYD